MSERSDEDVRHALRERVKELACLYDASAILAGAGGTLEAKLQALVERLPDGWQHPEHAAARLELDGRAYASPARADERHALAADVRVASEPVGRLEVVYDGAVPAAGGEPFLEEERLLLAELAHRVGAFLEHERGRARGGARGDAVPPPGEEGTPLEALRGDSDAMARVRRAVEKAARTDATILVMGESGTGKELVARAIHYASARRAEPFVAVNCAAIPESLVESELFGYVKGAFTGATHTRDGFFQTARGGTLFLDEVGETSLAVQAKLLRVLEDREIRMVGSDHTVRADVRVVAATNSDLPARVRAQSFRADLYFRLNVLRIELPPLRERPGDVLQLARHFLGEHERRAGRALALTDAALRALAGYDWPGNVRELENLVHRLAILSDGGVVDVDDLPGPLRSAPPPRAGDADLRPLAEVEREHVRAVLRAAGGNRTRAAAILGIDRKTLRKKLGDAPDGLDA